MSCFSVEEFSRGKYRFEKIRAGGSDLEYGKLYRTERGVFRSIFRFVQERRTPDDPPAWDIIAALFPGDPGVEGELMALLKEGLLRGHEATGGP